MVKRIVVLTVYLFVVSGFYACNKREVKNIAPNILFIAVDDLKPMLGCYGDSMIITPNIDQIASEGYVFLNNHCQVAVCGASRASLLTGQYADASKVWSFENMREGNPDIPTLPQYFKNNGYYTANIGKIFDYRTVDKYSDSVSWDYVFPVTEEDYYPYYSKETGISALYHYQSDFVKQKYEEYKAEALKAGVDTFRYAFQRIAPATESVDAPDDAYKDGIFGKLAVEKIQEFADQKKPFFLAVGFHKPHLPFVAPKKYWDLYDRDKIELAEFQKYAENDVEYSYHNSSELRKYTDEHGNWIYEKLADGERLEPEEQAHLIHGYMATVSCVDAQIGKIIQELKANDLYENTIIVLWGDHGWHLGDHNMWGKATNFEQSTRSPLILTGGGIGEMKTNSPSEFVDIYPTLCEMAGLSKPSHLQGESLLNIMNGTNEYKYAVSQFSRGNIMGYAIRDERYRYVEWVSEGFHVNANADLTDVVDMQLFDYKMDSLETRNLAYDQEYFEVKEKLAAKLHEFHRLNKVHAASQNH